MTPEEIKSLHLTYEKLSGWPTRLDFERERKWFEWAKFRPQEPFTQKDLEIVILWIVKEYKAERRTTLTGLRFNYLIGRPDEFEELLNQIKAERRAKVRPNPLHVLRKVEPAVKQESSHSRHVSEIVKGNTIESLVEQMRKAVG